MPEETYFKDVKKSTFYFDWVPTVVVAFLTCLSIYIMFFVTLHILFDENFIVGSYLPQKFRSYDTILFSFGCLFSIFLDVRRNYRLAGGNPFASINNERLILNFGRDSFPWDSIQSVDLECKSKLTVTFSDEGKPKKEINDLKWLSKKENFIYSLKNNCSKRNILYREVEMTYSSQIRFYLIIMKRFLFEPSPTKE